MSFSDFSLEECIDCNCDFVAAYDGSTIEDPEVGRVCGGTPSDLQVDGTQMLVRFVSDASTEFAGFRASNTFPMPRPERELLIHVYNHSFASSRRGRIHAL